MTYRPPIHLDKNGLEEPANPDPVPALAPRRTGPLKIAGFILLFLLLSLVASAVFLAITIGVTILVAQILPKQGVVDLVAPVAGVGVASVCFGAASRFRKGRLKNRYGLFRRPPKDMGARRADR